MKNFRLLSVIAIVILLNSCSSMQKKVQDKWWYEVSNYGDDIIMFTSTGKTININDDDKYNYTSEDNKINIIISDKKTENLEIMSVTETELIISNGKREKDYRIAKQNDFIIGRWKTSIKGEKVTIIFKKNNDWEMRAGYSVSKEGMYSFSANKIKISEEEYTYKFSEDYMNLELTGKENLVLIRKI